jgi:hypothetical protein
MTLYLLKVHLQMFLSIPITEKCQILSRDTLVASEQRLKFATFLKDSLATVLLVPVLVGCDGMLMVVS